MTEEREILEWQQFGDACRELTQSVVDSGFEPDIVLSITRGGLLPAGVMDGPQGIYIDEADWKYIRRRESNAEKISAAEPA